MRYKLHMLPIARVANCMCCTLHVFQNAHVANGTCCKLHLLQIACVANYTYYKLHVLQMTIIVNVHVADMGDKCRRYVADANIGCFRASRCGAIAYREKIICLYRC